MRRLFLIRHADPRIQADAPAARWRLSDRGVERARVLAARIAPRGLQCIHSSVEPKAIATAWAFADAFNVPVRSVPGLHEHERSGVSLLSPESFEEAMRAFFAQPSTCVFGDESAAAAGHRFETAVMQLVRSSPGDLVVVTHGTVLTLMVAAACGVEPFEFWKALGLPAAVTLTLPAMSLDTIERLT